MTDRYTKAIEQLGSDKLDVRIGGIYALERIARDSAIDHPAVMEVLSAFIREHAREEYPGPEGLIWPDVQAALTVVGRRDEKRDIREIDLSEARLGFAKLAGAKLAGANLSCVDFTRADLYGAILSRAFMDGADVDQAILFHAHLNEVDLVRGGESRQRTLRRCNGPHRRKVARRCVGSRGLEARYRLWSAGCQH